MKKSILFGTIISAMVAGPTLAQTSTTPTSSRDVATERVETVQEKNEVRRTELSERSQERITNLAANMSNRFDAVIGRLEKIISRLERRLDKLSAEGQDVSAAQDFVATAKQSLSLARDNMSTIDNDVVAFVRSEEPLVAWQELRQTYTETKSLVRSAHADLRAAILSLKNPQIIETEEVTE